MDLTDLLYRNILWIFLLEQLGTWGSWGWGHEFSSHPQPRARTWTTHTDSEQWTKQICQTLSLTIARQWKITWEIQFFKKSTFLTERRISGVFLKILGKPSLIDKVHTTQNYYNIWAVLLYIIGWFWVLFKKKSTSNY